jgi:ABC-type phosphate/phosphonate transport system substrate-binding protein
MKVVESVATEAQARIGRRLRDKWRLEQLLGVGGMAAVYAATHRNGSRVAIKMLHPELSTEAGLRERFLREGYVANAVDHPGVVRVLDDDTDAGTVFLVMELLDGETAEARQSRAGGRLPETEALAVMEALLSVLHAAHDKGIVHRDVKPENIFLAADGTVKLLDFGIARVREGASKLTITGTTWGTPAFMAPEQALGHADRIGPWTDVWSAGAVLYSLITGNTVHPGSTANEVLVNAATKVAPSLSTILPRAAPALVRLIDRALAFEPSARFASAAEMRIALKEAQQALESPARPPRPSIPDTGDTRLRIGLVSEAGEQARGVLEVGLEGALREPCRVRLWPSYASLVDGLAAGEVDLAWLPPVAYLRAREGAVKLLAVIQRGSRTSYKCALLGRMGVVDSLEQVAGKRAAWVDAWSAGGYIVPRALFRAAGYDPDRLFAAETFCGNYDAVLAALRSGQADVGSCYARLDAEGKIVAGPWQTEPGLSLLAVGGPIPADTLCTSGSLEAARFAGLQQALVGKPAPPALLVVLQATALRMPDPAPYDVFAKMYLEP